MKIAIESYNRLAKVVGGVLTFMGVSLIGAFGVFLATGDNLLAAAAPGFNGTALLVVASIGAFALPLGVSLFSPDSKTSARLRIAAGALGLMALLRLAAFGSADMRELVGIAPLVEFFVLGGIAAAAFFLRPENESPLDCRLDVEIDAPASEAWQLLAEQFGEVAEFAGGVQSSSMEGEPGVGAVRVCQTPPVGPFASARITEELVEFDRENMKYTYLAGGELPRAVPAAKNRWTIDELGANRCRVRGHASVELKWWALPFAALIGRGIHSEVARFGEDLRHRLETGTVRRPKELGAKAPA